MSETINQRLNDSMNPSIHPSIENADHIDHDTPPPPQTPPRSCLLLKPLPSLGDSFVGRPGGSPPSNIYLCFRSQDETDPPLARAQKRAFRSRIRTFYRNPAGQGSDFWRVGGSVFRPARKTAIPCGAFIFSLVA